MRDWAKQLATVAAATIGFVMAVPAVAVADVRSATSKETTAAKSVKACYFNLKWSKINLTFSYSGDEIYYRNALQAAKNWTNLNTALTVNAAADEVKGDIQFLDVNSTAKDYQWYAQAVIPQLKDWLGPFTSPPKHPHNPKAIIIKVNRAYMPKLDDFHRTYALTHEIGHALGLAHPDQYCNVKNQSIMDQGGPGVPKIKFNTPRSYDIVELKDLYGLPRG